MTTREVTYYDETDLKIVSPHYAYILKDGRDTYSSASKCPVCNRWFRGKRARQTCSDACRSKLYRQKHGAAATKAEAAQKAISTKSAQVHETTCKTCGRPMKVDGLHTAQQYCSNACKQRQYRQRKTNGDPRTPRQILIDDALLTLKNAPQLWNTTDFRTMHSLLDNLANTRGGKVLDYWNTVIARSCIPYNGPEGKLISRIVINHMIAKHTRPGS